MAPRRVTLTLAGAMAARTLRLLSESEAGEFGGFVGLRVAGFGMVGFCGLCACLRAFVTSRSITPRRLVSPHAVETPIRSAIPSFDALIVASCPVPAEKRFQVQRSLFHPVKPKPWTLGGRLDTPHGAARSCSASLNSL